MLTVKAPAKINWSLFVLDKREDGYHNIISLMQCIGLYDALGFELSDTLTLDSGLDLPDWQNLVFKAASLLKRHTGIDAGARITLSKGIPAGAGLGGGSSDAAYTLMALNDLLNAGLGVDQLRALGASLGSDVPFFFDGPLALAEGRGERLNSLPGAPDLVLLLVKPECSVPTSWAYGEIDKQRPESPDPSYIADKKASVQSLYRALVSGDLTGLAENMHNDFEDAITQRYPVIGSVKERLLESGASAALMSGSGSTVFGLFDDENLALKAAKDFPSCFCRVARTLK